MELKVGLMGDIKQSVPKGAKISNGKNIFEKQQIVVPWVKSFSKVEKKFKNFNIQILLFDFKVLVHSAIRMPIAKQLSKLKWIWKAQFLSYTLHIFKIFTSFRDIQMILLWFCYICIDFCHKCKSINARNAKGTAK